MYKENYEDGYYHLFKDIEEHPLCWLFLIWSPRGPGKTFGALWGAYIRHLIVGYIRRTKDDIETICSGCNSAMGVDLSPYVPINRIHHTNITGQLIPKINGLGAFYANRDEEGQPDGNPISYGLAMSCMKKLKSIDLTEIDMLIFDEFIPQAFERISQKEGEALMDLYMTICRDREAKGRPPLILVLMANSEAISTPVTRTLGVVDDMAEMQANNESTRVIEDRGIFLHRISGDEFPVSQEMKKTGIYKAMANTAWGRKAFGGEFTNNDFSHIDTISLKGCKPFCWVKYNEQYYYVYRRIWDSKLYMCKSKFNRCDDSLFFDLTRESEQKRFYKSFYHKIKSAVIQDRMVFQSYQMYDLIENYTKLFKI